MDRRGSRLSRRAFVAGAAGVGLVAGCGRLPWHSEGPTKFPRIGVLVPVTSMDGFEQGLHERGYIKGQNLSVDYRSAEGRVEQMPVLAAELVALGPEVIVAVGERATRAALSESSAIPIVTVGGDPLRSGLVDSLARPGGTVTGISDYAVQLYGKRLELLRETVPTLTRAAILVDATSDERTAIEFRENEAAAQMLGVQLQFLPVREAGDLSGLFDAASREHADAAVVLIGPATGAHRLRIAELALEHRLPLMADRREWAVGGALMAYGPSTGASHRRAAYYVDRILKGAKPADLPVEQPMIFDFVVNMKAARALGITFPNEIMLQVTEVIQ